MNDTITLEIINHTEKDVAELSELLTSVVDQGASIGFLPPLPMEVANEYWGNGIQPDTILLVARHKGKIAGTVQLALCTKQNGLHRAEICKLMTHPKYRRKGIARILMNRVEELATQNKRSLLVLDTREGDPSNDLYLSLNYIATGRIPNFALSANGNLDATVFYYKILN